MVTIEPQEQLSVVDFFSIAHMLSLTTTHRTIRDDRFIDINIVPSEIAQFLSIYCLLHKNSPAKKYANRG